MIGRVSPGRGDAPARTRVTRLRVGKLLARSQSRQTDCPRFSRHTRWPPGTDPSPRETQTTPAPRKTLKYTDNQPAGVVPVTSPPPTTPRRGGPGYIWQSHHLFHPQIRHPRETQTTPATTVHSPRETQTTPAPRKTLKYTDNQPAGAVPVTPTRTSHHPQGPNGLSRTPPGPSAPASTGCAPRLSQPRAARSVTWAPASSTRSRGLSSTLRPRRPPEMMIVSWSRHEESMNRR